MNEADGRDAIAGGQHRGWRHLLPIVKVLIERGHPAFDDECEYGFFDVPGGFQCQLGRGLTDDDWIAINQRFVIPETIVFINGMIRDDVNQIDIIGIAEFTQGDRRLTFDDWEELERQAGRRR